MIEGQVCRGGGQKTVCKVRLGVLNGTWVEAAKPDTQECDDFLWLCNGTGAHSVSLLCFVGVRWTIMPMRSLMLPLLPCLHHGLCVIESIREADLNHVGLLLFLDSHVPCHNICHGPCH